ncbi:MAG: TolC family protein [Phenylobacterium sp.]|uniref:TolC family protein n=1 Tax=Phenylobacterium sp. TaxID=1871053 RepID=UPI0027326562|nr:TolC family protein [Phenylobacterium sp.]MDP3745651.1 TolC family protein [Phenylobacterium sp.]
MHPLLRGPRLAGLLIAAAALPAAPALGQAPAVAPAAQPHLSLADALARAAGVDPSAGASSARRAAAVAAVRQAGVRPMPSLGLEVENFAGTGAYALVDRTETSLSYERALERGDKREARTGQARAELDVARLRGEVRRLDFVRDVQTAYAEALATEAELLVAEARLIAAHAAQRDIARRVKSARDPLFAGSRAEAQTAQAEIARDRAREAARMARAALAAFWNGAPDFALRLDDFFSVTPPAEPPIADTPDLALLEAERDVAVAAVRVAQSRSVADPTLRGGLRHFGQGNEVALVVGGSFPLGARGANRANLDRAQAERIAAEQEIAAARIAREREIVRLTARLRALALESERIRTEVIPPAIRTVEQVSAGFNRGGFEYLDVTEAQRALADARARRVEVLRDYHAGLAALDRLTGKHRALVAINSEERR